MWEMHGMQGGIGDSDDERNRSGRVEVIPTSYPTRGIPSPPTNPPPPLAGTSEDLHAWSIYRQVFSDRLFYIAQGNSSYSYKNLEKPKIVNECVPFLFVNHLT